jgi:hypothetical protein
VHHKKVRGLNRNPWGTEVVLHCVQKNSEERKNVKYVVGFIKKNDYLFSSSHNH